MCTIKDSVNLSDVIFNGIVWVLGTGQHGVVVYIVLHDGSHGADWRD